MPFFPLASPSSVLEFTSRGECMLRTNQIAAFCPVVPNDTIERMEQCGAKWLPILSIRREARRSTWHTPQSKRNGSRLFSFVLLPFALSGLSIHYLTHSTCLTDTKSNPHATIHPRSRAPALHDRIINAFVATVPMYQKKNQIK